MDDDPSDTTSGITILRRMSAEDVPRLCELEEQIFPDPWPHQAFLEQLQGDEWGGFVAENNGVVTGYACYYLSPPEAHLTNIAIDPEWRRKSIAKRLLECVFEVVKEASCEFLLLEVRSSNDGAIAFYERHEFRELYRRKNYYRRPVEDALVMVKYFDLSE
ncbi:MAG: ribosomal protein S18-alanine N-acetyltransferase [Candidatus Zixiibacteriota bacterium]